MFSFVVFGHPQLVSESTPVPSVASKVFPRFHPAVIFSEIFIPLYSFNGTQDGDQFEAGSEEESDPQDKNITERAMANKEVIFFM